MIFVIQEHWASTHHFDFRLERNGVLKSWAVPKGIPERPGSKLLAIQVEDHPLSWAGFEGTIAEGEYGAGEVKIWDRGTYQAQKWTEEEILFTLHGARVRGPYVLFRFPQAGPRHWLLAKRRAEESLSE